MSTPIEIVNSALRTLGARAITSFTQQINEARIANELYNDAVIDVLRAYPWNSEATRVRLLAEVETQLSEIRYAGTGLNDLTAGGTIDEGTELVFRIVVDSVGGTDTFRWKANDDEDYTEGVAMTGAPQLLSEGLEITFAATTGHTLGDEWHVDTKLPDARFDHRYRKPNDFLLGKQLEENVIRLFRIEGDFILTNEGEPLAISYTRLRGDRNIVGLFTDDVPYEENLITAIIARLKAEFAYPITKNDNLARTCWQLYREKLSEARAAARREGSIEVVQDTQYEDLRRGAGVIEDALDVGRVINFRGF